MKKFIKSLLIFLIFVTGCGRGLKFEIKNQDEKSKELQNELLVKKGDYLARIAGCHNCHTPREKTPDGNLAEIESLRFSGYPSTRPVLPTGPFLIRQGWILFNYDMTMSIGPWGISFASNLTPDHTGIGTWTEADFRLAIKEGKYKGMKGNRALLPPMPWQNYASLTDDDLDAIFAFLKSQKPVTNLVPQPFSMRENTHVTDTSKY